MPRNVTANPSTVPPPAPAPGSESSAEPRDPGLLDKHYHLLRRLHSLTGIMPVGVFVIFHLFTNSQLVIGDFDHEVEWIHSLPALLFLEVFGLWLPIAFHAGLGVWFMLSGKHNVYSYRYGGNIRYALQRWSAWIALIFIFFHVATLRWRWSFGGLIDTPFYAVGPDGYGLSSVTIAMAMQDWPIVMPILYFIGLLATVYHWSNGLWTAAITWGLTTTTKAMRRWGYVCTGMFAVLMVFGVLAIIGAATYEITDQDRAMFERHITELEAGQAGH